MRRTTSRSVIVTAATLAFILAGSTAAFAESGDAGDRSQGEGTTDRPLPTIVQRPIDRPEEQPPPVDRPTDRPADQPTERPVDRPADRPDDGPDRPHPCRVDTATGRPGDCPDDRETIWRRCRQAAETGAELGDEARRICHRIWWWHRPWKRCLHWADEQGLRIDDRRELWRLCHRLWWQEEPAR